ncbi:MAG: PilZ domain-containing protein [Treponema sp.]|nr:PilZ domain-containing protein [Treponema sp.]
MVQQEFEVYIVRDHVNLRRILKKYPDSIVFANIDDQMAEKSWEAWIRGIMSDETTANVGIGILSSMDDMALQRKYINNIKIKCGFTHVKKDIKQSIIQIMEILKVTDAKGRRKYIRATTDNEALTTINLPYNGDYVKGIIKDISVAGLSCAFPIDPAIEKNSLIKDIQIKLQSVILKAEGIVFGSRMDGITKIYVIIFTQRTDPDVRTKIRKYIQSNLQAKLDAAMK